VRVIAGEAKGARLAGPPGGTRPMTDRAREGLFSSLGATVVGARCADLYSGTGSIGIEALSRGAASCTFVDRGQAAVRTIRGNLVRTKLADRARVVRSDVRAFLRGRVGAIDLAFLDPPFAIPHRELRETLDLLAARLDRDVTFVLSRPTRDDTDVIPVNWRVATLLVYGDTTVLICREGG
jgi:16S rRNA (guanine966-N2)-methyltransferase